MSNQSNKLSRIAVLLYGAVCYLLFLATFLYLVGFVSDAAVPTSLASGEAGNAGFALVVNAFLLSLFAVQHNVMARPEFKSWWTRLVPKAIERSTFVLFSCLALIAIFAFWQPIPSRVWNVENEFLRWTIYGVAALGWGIVLLSTFLISHFELFGLQQVYDNLKARARRHRPFRTTGLYKYVRHPLMLGFLVAFWATPTMTLGHLLFAGFLTIWIVASIQLEERDLEAYHGEVYRLYRRQVPMLLPLKGRQGKGLVEDSLDQSAALAQSRD